MARNMIEAQTAIFTRLYEYCAKRGEPVPNKTDGRWVEGTELDTAFFKNALAGTAFNITPRRSILRMDYDGQTVFGTVGLAGSRPPGGFIEDDITAGEISVLLAETPVLPVAEPLLVSNTIGGSSDRDEGYAGHPLEAIKSLFGQTCVYKSASIPETETWRVVYEICVTSALASDTWIDEQLGTGLTDLSGLANLRMPFQTLCRSLFDVDPASLFLALYRCLEALYAYRSAKKLQAALGISMDWQEIAKAVENELGWRPKEEDSLRTLMALAEGDDIEAIFQCLGEQLPAEPGTSLPDAATKRVYKLRNVLVHYRPVHHSAELGEIDWNGLCLTLCSIISRVYAEVYQPEAVQNEINTEDTGEDALPEPQS